MIRRAVGSAGLALAVLLTASGAVAAQERIAVTMDVPTIFDGVPDPFVATGIAGCSSGEVSDGGGHVEITPAPGVLAGIKVFDCDGSDSGFVVRLNARFGPGGSTGTWAIVAAWGALAGVRGSGSLMGESIPNGIFDHYTGSIVR